MLQLNTLQSFWIVLGYGICYCPMIKFFSTLLIKDDDGNTPIQHAGIRQELNNVIDVMEGTLA